MNFRVNIHGLICITAIVVMIVLSLVLGNPPVLYIAAAIILYAGIVFMITLRRERQMDDHRTIVSAAQQLMLARLVMGAHLSFILLTLALLLRPGDLLSQIAIFVGLVIFGMLVPFLVLSSQK